MAFVVVAECGIQVDGMQGRVKRRQGLREAAARTAQVATLEDLRCALCERPLGSRVEWHHRVPKSKGGVETVPLHPICHRAIHAQISNHELAGEFADLEVLRGREEIQRFLRWIVTKPANFNAPTRRRRT